MEGFKFELWEIKNGIVVTRPEKEGSGEDEKLRNQSVFFANADSALKEVQQALDLLKAHYAARTQKR